MAEPKFMYGLASGATSTLSMRPEPISTMYTAPE